MQSRLDTIGATGIFNDVVIRPRARAFIAYVSQLIGAVQYVDLIIDPRSRAGHGPSSGGGFPAEQSAHLAEYEANFELREAARRFPVTP